MNAAIPAGWLEELLTLNSSLFAFLFLVFVHKRAHASDRRLASTSPSAASSLQSKKMGECDLCRYLF